VASHREDKDYLCRLLTSVTVCKIGLAVVSGIVLLILCRMIGAWEGRSGLFALFFLSTVCTSLMPDYMYRGLEKMTAITIRTVAIRTFFTVCIFVFLKRPEDLWVIPVLNIIGNGIAWIFAPLGWGNWQAAVASITGLIAKENIVGTMGVLYGGGELSTWAVLAQEFTAVTGFSFLVFNLLCAPCFAAMGAIKREMNSAKWTFFAIAYECGFAYVIALCINQIGGAFTGNLNIIGLIISILLIAFMLFMLFKPYKEANKLTKKVKVK
jgi:hypothetical protein